MKLFWKKHKWKVIIFGLIWVELFILYLIITSNTTYGDLSHCLTGLEFNTYAEVTVNNDKVGAGVRLKEVIHGLDGLTYRYIVKTDCPSWDYETRYVSNKPLEWADEYASAEVIIYDEQIRYNGTVYASGQYYTIPILGGISSETKSIEEWENSLMIQAYQTYVSAYEKNKSVRSTLVFLLIVIPVAALFTLLLSGPKKKNNNGEAG